MTLYNIKGLEFSYPGSEKKVLDGVDIQVREGDVISLLGCNGAGKSTLLNCMLGLLHYQAGEIYLEDKPLHSLNERRIAAMVGFVPQVHTPSFDYTVREFVVMGCAPKIGLFSKPGKNEYQSAQRAMELLGISELGERAYTKISGGQRQQAAIARAIAGNPKIVLLDEPTAHLDFSNQLRVLRIISELSREGYAVVFTTHNPDHAFLLEGTVALLDGKGKLTVGPAEKSLTEEKLKEVYGRDVRIMYIEELGRKACLYPGI